ncbi:retrovirus-related pol polyprotein LINE-1 [Tanacetum coccineum]
MSGRYTMEVIHIIRSLMEKYRERQKDLHLAFLDLEKAYDNMWVYTKDQLLAHTGFVLILDELTKGIQESIPWCLIFADDIVLVSETPHGLNGRLEQWRKALEDKGLGVNKEKTEYIRCNFNRNKSNRNEEEEICIVDHIL